MRRSTTANVSEAVEHEQNKKEHKAKLEVEDEDEENEQKHEFDEVPDLCCW